MAPDSDWRSSSRWSAITAAKSPSRARKKKERRSASSYRANHNHGRLDKINNLDGAPRVPARPRYRMCRRGTAEDARRSIAIRESNLVGVFLTGGNRGAESALTDR